MSVRGERTIYRERSVERDYQEQPRRTYTTVRRYQVPESISRTIYKDEEEDDTKEKIVIRRTTREDTTPSSPSRHSHKSRHDHDEHDYRVTETKYDSRDSTARDDREVDSFRITRTERSADPPRRDVSFKYVERDTEYDHPRSRSEYKSVERDTEVTRAPSPPSPERVREFRFERERDYSPPREQPYDIERYSKSTEYFAQPQPQPIIIRDSAPQAPIIIREERREPQKIIIRREEPHYEFIERKEVVEEKDESRSLVKSEAPAPEPSPSPQPAPQQQPEENYFYERRVVERRRRSESHDRKTEKDIRPRDSASNYSSDDSYEYVRKERTYEDDRDHHHKRHLAEGALAGIGAAEIIRHHRKSEGKSAVGRGRSALGGAAVGALGAEAISRVRSMRSLRSLRRGSESRSRSGERHHRRKHHSRSRSRSRGKSLTRSQTLGGLAAVAAVGALAGYALKNRGNKETVIVNDGGHRHHRRSRSRKRRGSVDSREPSDFGGSPTSEHRDPDHRNRRIAQAGLASAAAAGIWEKVRSRSRGGRERSKSRIRQGVPIAAAGLGGAALAGLYEKNKANREAKKDAIIEDELHRGRRRSSRSRSRSRSVPAPYPRDDRRSDIDGRGLIAYGGTPIYPEDRYHSDESPAVYRRRGGSDTSSPDTRRHRSSRSRSRGRNLAEIGAAAGAAGVAAHELGKRRERSRAARERSRDRDRQQNDSYYNNNAYPNEQPYSPPPMGNNGYLRDQYQNNPYGQQQAYPSSNFFPPPPTGEHAYAQQNAYPAYNPADYANQPPQQHPYDTSRGVYGESDATLGQPNPNDTYAGDQRYGNQDPGRGRGRPDPENVSAPTELDHERESQEANGLNTPRARSTSRVRFDLRSNTAHSPKSGSRRDDAKRDDPFAARYSDDETGGDRKHRHRRRKGKDHERGARRHSHRDDHDRDNDSDDTEELPDRFDEHGNRKSDDPFTQKINDLLGGKGGGGDLFKDLLGGLMGGHDERGSDDGHTSRRRHRR